MTAAARYGDPAATLGVVNDVLNLQLAHRSVRRFAARDVTDDELTSMIAAAQSAPTSSRGASRRYATPSAKARSRWPDGTGCAPRWSAWVCPHDDSRHPERLRDRRRGTATLT